MVVAHRLTTRLLDDGWYNDPQQQADYMMDVRMDNVYEIRRLMAADVAFGIEVNPNRINQDGEDIVHRNNVLRDSIKVQERDLAMQGG